jgi:hypothetical protein
MRFAHPTARIQLLAQLNFISTLIEVKFHIFRVKFQRYFLSRSSIQHFHAYPAQHDARFAKTLCALHAHKPTLVP